MFQKCLKIGNFEISNNKPFVLISGPCAIESLDHSLFICSKLKEICLNLNINFIFKSSFDKANRTSSAGERGIGIEEGLEILAKVKENFNVPIITDVHLPQQCEKVAKVADILQIPAFLCRQTDLLEAAAKTLRPVHVKKGQFLSPYDMQNVIKKLENFGCNQIMICDRGTCFGYNNLVSDFRGLPIMAKFGYPVVFDATHSVQLPSANGHCSSGEREFAPVLSRAAVAVGISALFIETHDNPEIAPCDGPNMIYLKDMEKLLSELKQIDNIAKGNRL